MKVGGERPRRLARRIVKVGREVVSYGSHYLGRAERRRKSAPFYEKYPYSGRHSLRSADQHTVVDLNDRFLFHRIPKAANSVLTASLVSHQTGQIVRPGDHDAMKAVRSTLREPSSLSAEEVGCVDELFKFVVVRNPYDRVLSAYLSKVAPYELPRRRTKPLVNSARPPDWTSAPSFAGFCQYLADGGLYYNGHWVPQTDYLLLPLDKYDYVGHVETLDSDFDAICKQIFGGEKSYRMVREDRRHATRAGSMRAKYYTDALYDLVHELYAADFEAFQYSPRAARSPDRSAVA